MWGEKFRRFPVYYKRKNDGNFHWGQEEAKLVAQHDRRQLIRDII